MSIEKKVKVKIIEDWQNVFSQLTLYSQNKLYKIVGPCVLGIELIESPNKDSYSPYFSIYSLWGNRIGNDIKASLAGPILLRDFKTLRGFQCKIPYAKHNVLFYDMLDSIENQIPVPLEGNISLNKLLTAIEDYSKLPPLSAAPNSYLQAALLEAKLKIALFMSSEEAQKILNEIIHKTWDISHFKICGVDIDRWLQGLEETIANRIEFLKVIEINKLDKIVEKFQRSQLTP